jgi:hypothetical protein
MNNKGGEWATVTIPVSAGIEGPPRRGEIQRKTKEIKADTFDNTGPHDAVIFNKSLKKTLQTTYNSTTATTFLAVCNMMLASIVLPDIPQSKPNPN